MDDHGQHVFALGCVPSLKRVESLAGVTLEVLEIGWSIEQSQCEFSLLFRGHPPFLLTSLSLPRHLAPSYTTAEEDAMAAIEPTEFLDNGDGDGGDDDDERQHWCDV